MNKSAKKFTKTEEEILIFLFAHPTTSFRGRVLAGRLKQSAPGVIKSARNLEKMSLLKISKDFSLSIGLNRENKEIFTLKRINNLSLLYKSGLVSFLSGRFPGSAVLVFGSYAYGEDTEGSDIDLAVIGYPEKELEGKSLMPYEKSLERNVHIHFFRSLKEISKNLKENLINGVVLDGVLKL